jgi:hypothetical protein
MGEDLTNSGKDLLESVRADKALHQGDVGTMLCVQGKSLGEDRKEAGVELSAHHPKGHRPSLKRRCDYISTISSLLHGSAKPQ